MLTFDALIPAQNRIQCTAVDIPYLLLQALTMLNSTNDNDTMHIQAIKACTGALLNLVIDTRTLRRTHNIPQ